jgi:hypothetical protein
MIQNKDLPLIKVLSSMKPEDLQVILDVLPDDATEIICECVYNVLNTDIKLSPKKNLIYVNSLNRIVVFTV